MKSPHIRALLKQTRRLLIILSIGVVILLVYLPSGQQGGFMRPDHDAESHLTRQAEIPIQLDGGDVPVRYYTVEPGSPESDTTTREETILFVHGLRDNALYFERIARRFASRGFRSFLLELPGYDSRSWGTSVQLNEYQ